MNCGETVEKLQKEVVCVHFFLCLKLQTNSERTPRNFKNRSVNEARENQQKVHNQNTKNAPEGKFGKEKGKQNKLSA